jgi:hypothetical protein
VLRPTALPLQLAVLTRAKQLVAPETPGLTIYAEKFGVDKGAEIEGAATETLLSEAWLPLERHRDNVE